MKLDGRKNNGNKGHSTKSKSPNDKRTHESKKDLQEYRKVHGNKEQLFKVLNKARDLAIDGDMKAAALWLSYILGKPVETKDVKVELNKHFPEWLEE